MTATPPTVPESPCGMGPSDLDAGLGAEPSAAKMNRAQRKRAARKARIETCEPVCAECGNLAELVKGDRIYPHRADLHVKNFYLCACGAYVGCHPFTRLALGKPAGPATRAARNKAHNCFDILWRRKMRVEGCEQSVAREAAYAWLADQLGYERGKCHIAWMTAPEARAVVRLCDPYVHGRQAPSPATTPTGVLETSLIGEGDSSVARVDVTPPSGASAQALQVDQGEDR